MEATGDDHTSVRLVQELVNSVQQFGGLAFLG